MQTLVLSRKMDDELGQEWKEAPQRGEEKVLV